MSPISSKRSDNSHSQLPLVISKVFLLLQKNSDFKVLRPHLKNFQSVLKKSFEEVFQEGLGQELIIMDCNFISAANLYCLNQTSCSNTLILISDSQQQTERLQKLGAKCQIFINRPLNPKHMKSLLKQVGWQQGRKVVLIAEEPTLYRAYLGRQLKALEME